MRAGESAAERGRAHILGRHPACRRTAPAHVDVTTSAVIGIIYPATWRFSGPFYDRARLNRGTRPGSNSSRRRHHLPGVRDGRQRRLGASPGAAAASRLHFTRAPSHASRSATSRGFCRSSSVRRAGPPRELRPPPSLRRVVPGRERARVRSPGAGHPAQECSRSASGHRSSFASIRAQGQVPEEEGMIGVLRTDDPDPALAGPHLTGPGARAQHVLVAGDEVAPSTASTSTSTPRSRSKRSSTWRPLAALEVGATQP